MILAKRLAHDKWIKNIDIYRATGLNQAVISMIMNGRRKPYDSEAKKIADCLGYDGDISALFEEENGMGEKDCELCSSLKLFDENENFKDYETSNGINVIDSNSGVKLKLIQTEYSGEYGFEAGNAYLFQEPTDDGELYLFPINYCPICGRLIRHGEYNDNRDKYVSIN